MRKVWLLCVLIVFLGISCDDLQETVSFDPSLTLEFSHDTIAFDTLLSDIKSPIQRFTVFNPNEAAIQLSSILLGLGDRSDYSLIINGKESNTITNEVILGGDSIQVLVDVTIFPRDKDLPYLVKDSVIFSWNGNMEDVKLVSWGQDAIPLSRQAICNETWTNQRPYIIEDTVLVEENCLLTIEKGAKVYFKNNAGLFIQGRLVAEADSSDHIIFTNSRFDSGFDAVPGQWNGIFFLEGSTNNSISFAEISNAQVGLRIGTPDEDDLPDIFVRNTKIFNMSVAGILAFTSDIMAQNTLIYNCATYLVGGFAGGNYTFNHCTFSNETSSFAQDDASIQFSDNIVISEAELLVDELRVGFTNSILWGANDEELLINNGGGTEPNLSLIANIIRSATSLENNITSQEFNFPGFTAPFNFDFSLDTLSNAKDRGEPAGIKDDITGHLRDEMPDIGAYERIE